MTTTSSRRDEDEIDLLRYGRFLASYWAVLFVGAVAGAVIGVTIASLMPRRFQSSATLVVTPSPGVTAFVLTPPDTKALVANQTNISETLTELGLNRQGWTTDSFIDDALEVQPIPSTNLVRMSVILPDPTQARRAASLLATKAVALSRSIDREGGGAALNALDKQVAEADVNMEKAQQRLLEYDRTADLDLLEAEVRVNLERSGNAGGAAGASQRNELYKRRLERAQLKAVYESTTRLYGDLLARQVQARSLGAADRSQLVIVDAPVQPDHPVSRRRPQWGMLGALIGTAGGVVAALLINRRRPVLTA